jgi:hypothetical protein
MSVISGENLVPPVFNNPITTTLTSIPVVAGSFTNGNGYLQTYTTPTLQQGSTYLVIVNVLCDGNDNGLFTNSIEGSINNEYYIIGGNQILLYDVQSSSEIYVGNTTFQSATPISPLVTQPYVINFQCVDGIATSPTTATINPTGSFIQILQLS